MLCTVFCGDKSVKIISKQFLPLKIMYKIFLKHEFYKNYDLREYNLKVVIQADNVSLAKIVSPMELQHHTIIQCSQVL